MGDEEDGLADLRLQAQELVLQALATDRVDRAEGLVHQHHQRVRGKGTGDADPLLLAARELRRVALAELGVETDQLDQLGGPRPRPLLLPAEQLRHGADVLGDRAVGEEADLLDHVTDLAPQLGGVAAAYRLAANQDVALCDLDHAVDHPHRRRLAAAGRPDQDADLTGGDLEREVLDGGDRRVAIALCRACVADGGGAATRLLLVRLVVGHSARAYTRFGPLAMRGTVPAGLLVTPAEPEEDGEDRQADDVQHQLVVELDAPKMSSRLGRVSGIRPATLKRPSIASAARIIVSSIRATIRTVKGQP